MINIKNKTIISLLLVTIIVTVASTIISVNKIQGATGNLLTGAATDTAYGEVNISITASTSITNNVLSINFSSGFVADSCTACELVSDGRINHSIAGGAAGNCCERFPNVSQGFLLENTGNLNISIYYNCSAEAGTGTGNCSAAAFIGGTNPGFQIKMDNHLNRTQGGAFGNSQGINDTGGSCRSYSSTTANAYDFGGWNISHNGSTTDGGSSNPEGVWVDINTTSYLCGNASHFPLDFSNGEDAGVLDINLTIPEDAPTGRGVMSANFTFTATSSG
jgi:hypothetical protein